MLGPWNRFAKSRNGVAAIEFAVSLPIFLALVVGIVEIGRALIQATAIEKGLHAGAMYVARAVLPVDAATTTAITNLVQRGSTDASAPYLVEGWGDPGATVDVVRQAVDYPTVGGVQVPVFQLTATVPFTPIIPILMPAFTITSSHQQAYIGR